MLGASKHSNQDIGQKATAKANRDLDVVIVVWGCEIQPMGNLFEIYGQKTIHKVWQEYKIGSIG